MIQEAKTNEELKEVSRVFTILRPHLVQEKFVETVQHQMQEGYHMLHIEDQGEVAR